MNRRTVTAGTAVTALLLLTGGQAANAATTSFTIHELNDQGARTFTSEIPNCTSGTWMDDVQLQAPAGQPNQSHSSRIDLIIHTVYTCDGGGSILVTKEDHMVFGETSLTGAGPFRITGGTGDLAGISGHGVDVGTFVYDTQQGDATITGVLTG